MNHTSERINVSDLGAIARFQAPPEWKEVTEEDSEAGGFNRIYYSRDFSPGIPAVTLSLFFRGTLVSDTSAKKFQNLLHKPDHELSPEEINSLSQVLSKLADEDAFLIRNCATVSISGRRVLVVDGEWKTSQTHFHGLMVDADESAREIQEIFFEAPAEAFEKYLKAVLESIRIIEWK